MTQSAGILFTLFLIIVAPAQAQDFSEGGPEQSAAIAVIEGQLTAFSRADGPAAFSHAAPVVKRKFPNPDIFMTMVRQGYGILIDPAGVEFLDMRTVDGDLYQAVRVIGQDGTRKIAIYQMERQPDGSWKIAGVYMTEDRQPAV